MRRPTSKKVSKSRHPDFCVAPSGLSRWWAHANPGRCPGLSCAGLSGRRDGIPPRRLTTRTQRGISTMRGGTRKRNNVGTGISTRHEPREALHKTRTIRGSKIRRGGLGIPARHKAGVAQSNACGPEKKAALKKRIGILPNATRTPLKPTPGFLRMRHPQTGGRANPLERIVDQPIVWCPCSTAIGLVSGRSKIRRGGNAQPPVAADPRPCRCFGHSHYRRCFVDGSHLENDRAPRRISKGHYCGHVDLRLRTIHPFAHRGSTLLPDVAQETWTVFTCNAGKNVLTELRDGRDCIAPSGLSRWWAHPNPGRCPGLSCAGLSGRIGSSPPRWRTPRTERGIRTMWDTRRKRNNMGTGLSTRHEPREALQETRTIRGSKIRRSGLGIPARHKAGVAQSNACGPEKKAALKKRIGILPNATRTPLKPTPGFLRMRHPQTGGRANPLERIVDQPIVWCPCSTAIGLVSGRSKIRRGGNAQPPVAADPRPCRCFGHSHYRRCFVDGSHLENDRAPRRTSNGRYCGLVDLRLRTVRPFAYFGSARHEARAIQAGTYRSMIATSLTHRPATNAPTGQPQHSSPRRTTPWEYGHPKSNSPEGATQC